MKAIDTCQALNKIGDPAINILHILVHFILLLHILLNTAHVFVILIFYLQLIALIFLYHDPHSNICDGILGLTKHTSLMEGFNVLHVSCATNKY